MNNLGSLLQDQGKLDEAGVLFSEDLEASRATLGDRHPDTLSSINNLGRLLHDQGRLGEAETLLLEAHDGCAATLAEGHRTWLRKQAWLADVRRAQGRIESARTLVDARVLSTARAALGPTVDTTLLLEEEAATGPTAYRHFLTRWTRRDMRRSALSRADRDDEGHWDWRYAVSPYHGPRRLAGYGGPPRAGTVPAGSWVPVHGVTQQPNRWRALDF